MKKIYSISTLLLILFIYSCSSSSNDDVIITPPNNNNDVTYTNDVKPIIDNNCLNCHTNPPQNGAPMPLTTYDNVKEAVQNRGLIGKIESGAMPKNGTPLSTSQVQTVKDWQTGGFIQ